MGLAASMPARCAEILLSAEGTLRRVPARRPTRPVRNPSMRFNISMVMIRSNLSSSKEGYWEKRRAALS
jgi:hypothetical protein